MLLFITKFLPVEIFFITFDFTEFLRAKKYILLDKSCNNYLKLIYIWSRNMQYDRYFKLATSLFLEEMLSVTPTTNLVALMNWLLSNAYKITRKCTSKHIYQLPANNLNI